jgi:alpha-N-arabinofuranosidase
MNTGHHDAASLAVHVDAPRREVDGRTLPLLTASASTKGDTALISLSHLDAESSRTVVLDLRGRGVAGHLARVLSAESPAAHNTPERPRAVAPEKLEAVRPHRRGLELDLPPHSFVTVALALTDGTLMS